MDRVQVKREFRRVLWICPVCKLEDFEDRPMSGGASYEHTCKNGHKFNQSAGAMKEYNGCLSYSLEDYAKIDEKAVESKKDELVSKWVYEVKNPPPYAPPKASDLQAEIDSKLQEIQSLEARKLEAQAKEVIK